jgi:MFS family permease
MFLVSALGAGAAHASWLFIAARVLGGFAVGAASVMSPAYIAEVASARYRGRLATVQQMAIICGLFAAFLSNYLLARAAGASTEPLWLGRSLALDVLDAGAALRAVPAVAAGDSGKPALPGAEGRQQARAVLSRLYGEAAARPSRPRSKPAWHRTSTSRASATCAAGLPAGCARSSGWASAWPCSSSWSASTWCSTTARCCGRRWASESDALLINVLSGALSIGACLLTVLLIDRIGRKPLLWVGSVGMSVALVLMVVAFASGAGRGRLQLSDGMGRLALVAANVYVVFFNMSWGPVMWVMLGEMFPNQIRGRRWRWPAARNGPRTSRSP